MRKQHAVRQTNAQDAGVLIAEIVVPVVDPRGERRAQPCGDENTRILRIRLKMCIRDRLWGDEKEMVRTLNALAAEADLVLPGIHEGKILTKKETAAEIAAFYHDRGVDSVIVKLGADGAYWSTGGESGTVPAFPVKRIVDTVGAGDGFAAGVLSAVAEGLSLSEAARRGTVIGSIQITHRGDNEGLPTREDLDAAVRAGIV